jgi:hypothetical protein
MVVQEKLEGHKGKGMVKPIEKVIKEKVSDLKITHKKAISQNPD